MLLINANTCIYLQIQTHADSQVFHQIINFVIPRRNMQDLENVLMPQMLINQDLMLILIFTDKKFSLILSPQLGN